MKLSAKRGRLPNPGRAAERANRYSPYSAFYAARPLMPAFGVFGRREPKQMHTLMSSSDTSYSVVIRPLRWPDDRVLLRQLDTSYSSDRLLRVVCGLDSFTLEDVPATPAIRKTYPLTDDLETLQALDWVGVADVTGLVGMAAVRIEAWNRRAVLCHLYVAPQSRGKGIGGSLVSAAVAAARARAARCLWVETQTTNVGAVRFYERMGFRWCGLDSALYDPNHVRPDEVALFFVREF